MKKFLLPAFSIFAFVFMVQGQSARQITRTADRVADAYGALNLKGLDKAHLTQGNIKVIIEQSIVDMGDPQWRKHQFEVKQFRSFKGLEAWLKSREHEDGLPFRVSWPRVGCRGGYCKFFLDGGILHNRLYLQKLAYGQRKGKVFIKTLYLLNG